MTRAERRRLEKSKRKADATYNMTAEQIANMVRAVNDYESIGKAADQILPPIYAALAIALHDVYGWGHKRINRAFVKSQEVWQEHVDRNDEEGMVKLCHKITGIDVVGKLNSEGGFKL